MPTSQKIIIERTEAFSDYTISIEDAHDLPGGSTTTRTFHTRLKHSNDPDSLYAKLYRYVLDLRDTFGKW